MNRESALSGFRLAVLIIVGMALMSGIGALSSDWLIGGGIGAVAGPPQANRAADRAQADQDSGDPDTPFDADSTSGPFVSELPPLEDFVCEGSAAQSDKTVQGRTPGRDDADDDWLFVLAMIMGLAEGWNDDGATPWNSCQM